MLGSRHILSVISLLVGLFVFPLSLSAQRELLPVDSTVFLDEKVILPVELSLDTVPATEVTAEGYVPDSLRVFSPDPERAVWLSALCPGLGQIYNRRYWKLPIVIGGFVGLGYATNWNNNQFADYSQGYKDLMSGDPSKKSYLNFFPPTVNENDLDKEWLKRTFKSRKDYFRRNRDLCIISLVGMYFLCMVDAYIDASLAHFDISPDLSLDVAPALMPPTRTQSASVGMNWAFTF